ncbi:MAG: MvaI/BcnI family restriction endonuclease [Gammaproteobacteria bacterium]|nr:MvaI/BcnI family restriction endonuclease [Gammaproteobacteria bacterium]
MLSISDTSIEDASAAILKAGYNVSFLVPTQTGLDKSILDAHQFLRSFFKRTGLHDYNQQNQGNKKCVEAKFLYKHESFSVKASLYRPNTKKGDPRIWIYGLKRFAKARNLLALIVLEQQLYIFNCSNKTDFYNALHHSLPKPHKTLSPIAKELLKKLKIISKKGFIPTIIHGDTGVGMTLEAELGISANSSPTPDYHGIELKASRVTTQNKQRNRNQLFSKIPNWKLSPVSSARQLISLRGYRDEEGHQALRPTVSGNRVNKQGLYLDIDYANNYLRQMFSNPEKNLKEHDTTWLINDLKKTLLKKHQETFWVKAQHKKINSHELFHYTEVEHTSNPYIDKFETLIETGLITLDYTMHIKSTGKIRDHGYLFKLNQNNKHALFPNSIKYRLAE